MLPPLENRLNFLSEMAATPAQFSHSLEANQWYFIIAFPLSNCLLFAQFLAKRRAVERPCIVASEALCDMSHHYYSDATKPHCHDLIQRGSKNLHLLPRTFKNLSSSAVPNFFSSADWWWFVVVVVVVELAGGKGMVYKHAACSNAALCIFLPLAQLSSKWATAWHQDVDQGWRPLL